MKRRGNRRYYQRQDVLTIRQIRSLLYDQGFTIGGARQKMTGALRDSSKPSVESSEIKSLIKDLEQVIAKM